MRVRIAVFDDFECSVLIDIAVWEYICLCKVGWGRGGFGTVNDTIAISTGRRLVRQTRAVK